MLVRVKIDQLQTLRDLEVETYRETFGPYIVEEDLEEYFSHRALFGANREGSARSRI